MSNNELTLDILEDAVTMGLTSSEVFHPDPEVQLAWQTEYEQYLYSIGRSDLMV